MKIGILLLTTALLAGTASAANRYWDTEDTTGLQAGDGIWERNTVAWSSLVTGSTPLLKWKDPRDIAIFEANGSSTVTLNGTVRPVGLIFNGTGYTIAAGLDPSIAVSSGGIVANQTATIASPINLMADQTWTVANGADLIINATISGSGAIFKTDSGTLEFKEGNTYTGVTRIPGGTLLVNNTSGSGTSTGDVVVNSAESVLGGTGSIDGAVFVDNGTLAPGNNGVGTLTVSNNVTFASGTTYEVEVTTSSTVSDTLDVSGDLTLNGATLSIGTISGAGTTIALVGGTISGTFAGLADGVPLPAPNANYYIHYVTDQTPNHITINKSPGTTSSGIDLRAYKAADGVYVEFVAYDVEEDGTIRLALLDANGVVAWEGSVDVAAGPEVIARFLVPDLEAGGTYDFALTDEVGQGWSAAGVPVGTFKTEMVSASLTSATLSFDSLPERDYEVQWTAGLGGTWQTVTHLTADSEQTSVVVNYPEGPTGFFRIQLK